MRIGFKIATILLILWFALLTGCSTIKSRHDGPPNFSVDETKVPDAVPKKERLSKFGNSKYHVKGHCYHIMHSAKNYRARGIASWYGTLFHKQRTSSGETYNMLGMTAAHRTLPLPTYVRVTNLVNGKRIIVKVNDRGPFRENRIIDLSYVAAKKLGMLGRGTAYVEVETISLDPLKWEKYIRIGTFKTRLHAERLRKRIIAAVHSPVEINRHHQFYQVKVGPINDMATRELISHQLKSIGLKSEV